ncbi:unnamed protein product [Effrenium voratum]|uniref:Uncharacterized protein n=1 Tax=Effrenium voratum TaxID=2562239 RepID=A0AA36MM72_9DINO|nr:unnamed protein product [Effrenium voratum]CAJ1431388.1 unnamed protein product [Effrenium voratum]
MGLGPRDVDPSSRCAGMFVIFVSHQWLAAASPDPKGQQLAVLRTALRDITAGIMRVEEDLPSYDGNKTLPGKVLQKITTGYLFLDWFAIPQLTARVAGVNETSTQSDAAKAVQSIPAYVEASDLFVALVPSLTHQDTLQNCNYGSWLSRGWCRAELWCRLLSNRKDTSVILVFSSKNAEFMFPLEWQRASIAEGKFTVEADRECVTKLGEMALAGKLRHLQAAGPLSHYRFYLARRAKMLQETPQQLDLRGFLEHFAFPNLQAAVQDEGGMNGLLCAVCIGNIPMIRLLVEHKADVNCRLRGLGDFGYFDSQTPIMTALKTYQESSVVSTLIELRADVHAESRVGYTCGMLARLPEHVHALAEAKAELSGTNAICGAAAHAGVATVRAMLQCRSDPNIHTAAGRDGRESPLHSLALLGRGNPEAADIARLLLANRADANLPTIATGRLYLTAMLAQGLTSLWGMENCSNIIRLLASYPGITPLGCAALTGHSELVELLLEADADPLSNQRGDSPEDLARMSGHLDLLPMLQTFRV